MRKIASYVADNSEVALQLPEWGLIEAYKTIIKRFEKAPIKVELKVPIKDIDETVLLDLDDFRLAYRNPYAKCRLDSINSWPKYINEIFNGDMRALGLRSSERGGSSNSLALAALVDKSLGISDDREKELLNDPANRWLGPINGYLTEFENFEPNLDVGDPFRKQQATNVPVIMIQGDMDLSTPIENAYYLQSYFSHNHLVTVK